MLVKGTQVIGLPVLTLKNGRKIEDIDDVIYDARENKVKALLVDKGGWFSDAKVIPIESVHSIGKDAVIVEDEDVLMKASDVEEKVSHIAKDDTYLTKTKIITDSGTELGNVTDIFFDDKTGIVREFEVSEGLMKDMRSGKKRVKISDIETVGEEATIVRAYTEEKFEQQANQQGIQGSVQKAKEQAPDMLGQAKQKANEFGEKTKEKTQELAAKTKQKVNEAKENPQMQRTKDTLLQAKDTTQQKMQQAGQKVQETAQKGQKKVEVAQKPTTSQDEVIIRSTEEVVIPPQNIHGARMTGALGGQVTSSKKTTKEKASEHQKKEKSLGKK